MPRSQKKTLKIKFAVYLRNNGDGSSSPVFYADEALAEKAAEKDDERYGDDIVSRELTVDAKTGRIISGVRFEVEEDE